MSIAILGVLADMHLVRSCLNGREQEDRAAAWRDLDRRFRVLLFKCSCYRLRQLALRDLNLAEDIVQQVFLSLVDPEQDVLRRWEPGRGELVGFLKGQVRARIWSVLRQEQRRRQRDVHAAQPETQPGWSLNQDAMLRQGPAKLFRPLSPDEQTLLKFLTGDLPVLPQGWSQKKVRGIKQHLLQEAIALCER